MPQHRQPPPRRLPLPPPPHRLWGGAPAEPAWAKGATRDSPCRRKHVSSHLCLGNAPIKSSRFLLLQPRPGQECFFQGESQRTWQTAACCTLTGKGRAKPGLAQPGAPLQGAATSLTAVLFRWSEVQVGQPRVCLPLRAAASLAPRSVTVLCNVPCPSAHFSPLFSRGRNV